jgi:hypothetical protein
MGNKMGPYKDKSTYEKQEKGVLMTNPGTGAKKRKKVAAAPTRTKGVVTKKTEVKGTKTLTKAPAKKTYTKKTVAKVDKLTDKRNKLAKKAGKAAASGKAGSTAKTNRLTNRAVRKNKRMARVIKRNK